MTHNAESTTLSNWFEIKGKHFIVEYQDSGDREFSKSVLRYAENYYDSIADQLGFSRYQEYWTWDDRAKILIYVDQASFIKSTGLPPWSKGAAGRNHRRNGKRVVVSYKQEEGFFEGILPHEISHLILDDFFESSPKIIGWFSEGIAQLQEKGKLEEARKIIQYYVDRGQFIPFRPLIHNDIRSEKDPRRVALFYAQSVSMMHFLIKRYGSQKFVQVCRYIKEDKNFEQALAATFPTQLRSLEEFQEQWLKYLSY